MWNFIKNHLSIDEFKVSVLVIAFMGLIGVIIYSILSGGDFSSNLLSLTETLIYAIAGVNTVSGVASIVQSSKANTNTDESSIVNNVDEVTYGINTQDEK
jgi:hypothetical protein